MSQEFHREDRYIVIKHKDLGNVPVAYREHLVRPLFALQAHLPVRECVVVESDWPEYETVWRMIERRVTGQPVVTPAEELQAVLHWRDKHTQAIKEREALQQRLNDADQMNAEAVALIRETYNRNSLALGHHFRVKTEEFFAKHFPKQ